ncbi:heparan-alpha-glucosaminide N-acetyltransferase domain-containing protein [Blastococcus sp. BMG 814]|uniref:Heparan-alpha-glucosaminide N-acetyltransferase domain-containing protein n=1 Tax=Blastococcus carthaginiensis TaxID=3050034 RepID=A0ABT9IBI6_9ACTN|nr:heparan-alpha-glucosaminide N-acetyltransferase domain-containing protein [Blastococcus carthaginiensis]MDP5182923.1 heparan-alpha-glucosaminide N-acetyltransferase domain-containing protein [Blastococcus carthaginiensis]
MNVDVRRRIGGLDVARGLAVLGMFAAHLRVGGELHPDPRTWTAVVDGRSSILFATLAGISVALLSGRDRPPEGSELGRVRVRIVVRALWVFAFGLVLEALGTFVAVILGVYGVLFLLVLPFLRWPVRRLLVTAGVVAVVVPPLLVIAGQALTTAGSAQGLLASLLVTGYYPALLWIAFVLVGLAVGRLDLASGAVRLRLAAAGAAAAVLGYGGGWVSTELLTGGMPSAGPETGFAVPGIFDVDWLTGAEAHSGTTFEVLGSTGFAVLVVVGCLVLTERLPRLTAPVAAVGALALTVYATHLVAIRVLMEVMPGRVQGPVLWVWFAAAALAGAWGWRRTVGRGPLESLLTWTSSRAAGLTPSAPAI